MRGTLLVVAALALVGPGALAEETLTLIGRDGTPHPESLAALQALPPRDVKVSFQTGHGPESATYHGALLWDVLTSSGLMAGATPRRDAPLVLLVTGHDGYVAALAVGEVDPALEGKPVLLAWSAQGATLHPNELRLAVPADKHGARSVRDVVRIEVK